MVWFLHRLNLWRSQIFVGLFFFLLVFVFWEVFFERGVEKEILNEFFELSSHLRKIQMSFAIP